LSQDESVQNEEDLKKVKRHIQRAIFDSYDAGLSGILRYLNEFHKIFGALPELRKQIPEYGSFMDQADDAHDLIDKAVEKYDSRQEFYEECKPHWEKLRNIYRRLKRVTPTLDEIRRQRDSEQTTQQESVHQTVKGNQIAIWGIIAGVVMALLGIFIAVLGNL